MTWHHVACSSVGLYSSPIEVSVHVGSRAFRPAREGFNSARGYSSLQPDVPPFSARRLFCPVFKGWSPSFKYALASHILLGFRIATALLDPVRKNRGHDIRVWTKRGREFLSGRIEVVKEGSVGIRNCRIICIDDFNHIVIDTSKSEWASSLMIWPPSLF